MPRSVERAALAAAFGETSRACEAALARHLETGTTTPAALFDRHVTYAVALLAACAERTVTVEDLRLVHDACADAAAVCRAQPPTRDLAFAAERFAAIERACIDALDIRVSAPEGENWVRFLFADADVEVTHVGSLWRVRAGNRVATNRLLDVALDEVLQRSRSRTTELTVQILEWEAQAGND